MTKLRTGDFIGEKFIILSTRLERALFIILQGKMAMCIQTHRELCCNTDGGKEPTAFLVEYHC